MTTASEPSPAVLSSWAIGNVAQVIGLLAIITKHMWLITIHGVMVAGVSVTG
ncbi:hypothetical protein [Acidipropionibacterium jensenii]|uniref:hypothetical protein n=1 Tax=Acidipropionibacterium jensenii TaxID=1749 RepID=UPI00129BDAA4|nr:hypothetical protein [Acidipropionibacterium jensenii]